MQRWLLVVVCVGLFAYPTATECPAQCACVDHDIDCRSRGLTQVPSEGVSPHTTSWDLAHNNLTSLRHDAFRHCGHTRAVDLSHNRLVNVSGGVFSHMENLMSIDLSDNNISHVEFSHVKLDRLYALYLSHNPHLRLPEHGFELKHLKVLEMMHCGLSHIPRHFFAHMKRLEVLQLGRNRLSSLEGNVLGHLEYLIYVNLSGNKFVTLPSGLLDRLDVSVHVKLEDNPFVCECKTHHAYARYVTHRGHAPLQCSHFDARPEAAPLSHSDFLDFYRDHCSATVSPRPPVEARTADEAQGSPGDYHGAAVAATLAALLVVAVVVTAAMRFRRNVRLVGDTSPQRFSILKGSDEV